MSLTTWKLKRIYTKVAKYLPAIAIILLFVGGCYGLYYIITNISNNIDAFIYINNSTNTTTNNSDDNLFSSTFSLAAVMGGIILLLRVFDVVFNNRDDW